MSGFGVQFAEFGVHRRDDVRGGPTPARLVLHGPRWVDGTDPPARQSLHVSENMNSISSLLGRALSDNFSSTLRTNCQLSAHSRKWRTLPRTTRTARAAMGPRRGSTCKKPMQKVCSMSEEWAKNCQKGLYQGDLRFCLYFLKLGLGSTEEN